MRRVKVVFEKDGDDGGIQRYGYNIDKDTLSYVACQFDEQYNPSEVTETKGVGNPKDFAKRMTRLIKYALEEG